MSIMDFDFRIVSRLAVSEWATFEKPHPNLLMFFSTLSFLSLLFKTPPSEEPTLCIVDRRKARKFLFVERGNGFRQDFVHIRYKLNIAA